MTYDPERHHRRSLRLKTYKYTWSGDYFITICTADRLPRFGAIADGLLILNDAGEMIQSVWQELPVHEPGVELDDFVVMPNHFHGVITLTGNTEGSAAPPSAASPAREPTRMDVETMPSVGATPRGCPSAEDGARNPETGLMDTDHGPPVSGCRAPSPMAGQPRGVAPTDGSAAFPSASSAREPTRPDAETIPPVGATPRGCPASPPPTSGFLAPSSEDGQPRGVAPTDGAAAPIRPRPLSLPDIVHRFKSLTTKRYTDGVNQRGWPPYPGRLWERNYYEHIVRNEADLDRIRDYIAANPSRWLEDPEYPERSAVPR